MVYALWSDSRTYPGTILLMYYLSMHRILILSWVNFVLFSHPQNKLALISIKFLILSYGKFFFSSYVCSVDLTKIIKY